MKINLVKSRSQGRPPYIVNRVKEIYLEISIIFLRMSMPVSDQILCGLTRN